MSVWGQGSVREFFFFFVVGRMVWSIVRFRLLLYSARSGVNRVVMVLLALSCRSLSFVHLCMSCRKGWSLCSAIR